MRGAYRRLIMPILERDECGTVKVGLRKLGEL